MKITKVTQHFTIDVVFDCVFFIFSDSKAMLLIRLLKCYQTPLVIPNGIMPIYPTKHHAMRQET